MRNAQSAALCVAAWLAVVGYAFAGMEAQTFGSSVIGVNTSTAAYTLRGEVYGVYVTAASDSTNTVQIKDSFGVIFTNAAITTSGFYPVRVAAYSTAGAALTFVGGSNNTANSWYVPRAVAGPVTCHLAGAGAEFKTNTYQATIIYSRL